MHSSTLQACYHSFWSREVQTALDGLVVCHVASPRLSFRCLQYLHSTEAQRLNNNFVQHNNKNTVKPQRRMLCDKKKWKLRLLFVLLDHLSMVLVQIWHLKAQCLHTSCTWHVKNSRRIFKKCLRRSEGNARDEKRQQAKGVETKKEGENKRAPFSCSLSPARWIPILVPSEVGGESSIHTGNAKWAKWVQWTSKSRWVCTVISIHCVTEQFFVHSSSLLYILNKYDRVQQLVWTENANWWWAGASPIVSSTYKTDSVCGSGLALLLFAAMIVSACAVGVKLVTERVNVSLLRFDSFWRETKPVSKKCKKKTSLAVASTNMPVGFMVDEEKFAA